MSSHDPPPVPPSAAPPIVTSVPSAPDTSPPLPAATPSGHTPPGRIPPGATPPPRVPWRYNLLGRFASGGTSTVHRVHDRVLERVVAMKILDQSSLSDDVARRRFATEAQVTAQLDHPCIVPVYDLGDTPEGRPYITMKLVAGRTLRVALMEAMPLPAVSGQLDEFLGMFLKVCEAVAFAHSRGVVHRDLKPENIVLGEYGEVYVMDWGIARVLSRSTLPGGIRVSVEPHPQDPQNRGTPVGTLRYMAPEVAIADVAAIDQRTDVFSLGAILYELLTGSAPYEGTTRYALLYQAMNATVTPPEARTGGVAVAPALCRVALRAMAREPAERYPTVQALQRDIELFLRGAARFPTATYPQGALVVTEGAPGDAAYVITQGRCLAFKTLQGVKVPLREMGPGEVFGETAVFSDVPRTASVEALEEVVVMVVTREFLSEGLGLHTWMGRFVKVLADRFRDLDARLTEIDPRVRSGGSDPTPPPPPPPQRTDTDTE